MFDDGWERLAVVDPEGDLSDLTAAQLADCVVETHRVHQQAGCRMLQLAAAWANAHPKLDPEFNEFGRPLPGADRGRIYGAESNPEASEFCAIEFGALLATSTASAAQLIADAVDLRHRLPLIWSRVESGDVNPAKARRVAQATRTLSDAAAELVDRGIVEHLATLCWTRFLLVLSALVIEADPKAAEQKAKAAEVDRFVRAGQANRVGLKMLIAQANAGEVHTFLAMVNRIADILAVDGDLDSVDIRRSKAIGILAQPAYALHLLITHQHQPAPKSSSSGTDEDDEAPPEDLARVEQRFAAAEATERAGSTESAVSQADRTWAEANQAGSPDLLGTSLVPHLQGIEPVDEVELPVDPALVNHHQSVQLSSPLGIDYRRLRPAVALYVHLTDQALATGIGVARVADVGPVTVEQVRRFLTSSIASSDSGPAGYDIRVQPVLNPADVAPVDAYEIPLRLREAAMVRNPADVYPYGSCTSRRMDLDHTIPYIPMDEGGPPGQTSLNNLGPLDRTHHRDKTHGRGDLRQPDPGIFLYRSPAGWVYLTTNAGTLNLGNGGYAQLLWSLA